MGKQGLSLMQQPRLRSHHKYTEDALSGEKPDRAFRLKEMWNEDLICLPIRDIKASESLNFACNSPPQNELQLSSQRPLNSSVHECSVLMHSIPLRLTL